MAYTIPDGFELVEQGSNPAPTRAPTPMAPARPAKAFAIPDGFELVPEQPNPMPPTPPRRPGGLDLPANPPLPPQRPGYIDSAPVMDVPPDVQPGMLATMLKAAQGAIPQPAPPSPKPMSIPDGLQVPVTGADGQPLAVQGVPDAVEESPLEHVWNKGATGYQEGASGFQISEEDKKKHPVAADFARVPMGVLGALFGAGMAVPRAATAVVGEAAQGAGVPRDVAQRLERGLDAGVDWEFSGNGFHAPKVGDFHANAPEKPRAPLPAGFDVEGAIGKVAAEQERATAAQAAPAADGPAPAPETYTTVDKNGKETVHTPTDPEMQAGLRQAREFQEAQAAKRAAERPAEDAAATQAAAERAAKGDDTGQNIPETDATLKAQQDQLVKGNRRAQMFPEGSPELPLPEGMERVETPRGVFHYDPTKITKAEIENASANGRENDILDLGPASKADVNASAAQGSPRVNVTERTPDGAEVKTATGTQETAPAQAAAMEETKTPGNTVQPEPLDKTVAEREDGLLRGMGWSDADIAKMPPEQRADQVREAMDSGVEPVAGAGTPQTPPQTEAPKAAEQFAENAKKPGTRAAPIKATEPEHVDQAAANVAEPTPAQAEAGNYRQGHVVTEDGLPVTIENPKGSVRRGVGADGKPWETTMPAHYGYVKGTIGADGDHVDVYLGPGKANGKAFVVDQIDPKTGKFDEHKVVMHVDSVEQAAQVYASGFSDGSGHARMGAITETTPGHLKGWLAEGEKKQPFGKVEPARDNLFAKESDPSFLKDMNGNDAAAFAAAAEDRKDVAIKIGHAIDNLRAKDPNHPRLANLETKLKGVLDSFMPNRDTSRRPGGMPHGYERPTNKPASRPSGLSEEEIRRRHEEEARQAAVVRERDIENTAHQMVKNDIGMAEFAERYAGKRDNPFINAVEKRMQELYDARDAQAAADAEAAEKATADAKAKADAEAAAKTPEPAKKGREQIGVNGRGKPLFEDERGVRSYVDSGVRISESVRIHPGEGISVDTSARGRDFSTADEMAAEEAKTRDAGEKTPAGREPWHPANDLGATLMAVKSGGMVRNPAVLDFMKKEGLATGKAVAWESGQGLKLTDLGAEVNAGWLGYGRVPAGKMVDFMERWRAFREGEASEPSAPAGATPSPFDPAKSLPDAYADHFFRGHGFQTIVQARKFAKDAGHELSAKQVEEAIEHGVVKTAREIVAKAESPADAYNQLVALYANQPTLGTRTGRSVELQAYSTPAPLAYLASELAGITRLAKVLEPTAGNGMLVMAADPKRAFVNELGPERAANLREQGFDPHERDASNLNFRPEYDAVITNPPFGAVKEPSGNGNIHFDLGDIQPGYKTHEIDHAIALRALAGMKPDGKAVLIIGGINKMVATREGRSDAYNGKAKREFFLTLYKNYNVVDHFTVAGELYTKQGAGWPVDVIVIHGRGQSARKLPAVDVPAIFNSWDELKGKLDGAADAGRPAEGQVREPAADAAPASQPERAPATDGGSGGAAQSGERPDARPVDLSGAGGVRGAGDPAEPGLSVAEPAAEPVSQSRGERGEPSRSGERPAGEPGDAGLTEPEAPKAKKPKKQEQETEGQVAYTPHSARAQGLGTLVPKNMKTAVEDALKRVAEKRGDTDVFVAKALGMKPEEIGQYFSAEQADALALALDNFEKGAGFIIGDQTGIGKGRIVAGIIRYALNKGHTPVFVTEKPNLYGDMFRDMGDVGMSDFLGRDPSIFMTNSGENVPLSESVTLKGDSAALRTAQLDRIARDGALDGHDMVFTTYNQMQTVKGEMTSRQRALRALAPNSILILDEAHNAGGQAAGMIAKKEGAPPNRAEFVRELVGQAKAVFYSSATYAKRPDVMDLYSKTDMSKAVSDPSKLGETIAAGGVPMQQVVAAMLARSGQYMRRERSFAGVVYEARVHPVEKKTYAQLSKSLAAIHKFSQAMKKPVKAIKDEIKAEAGGMSSDGSTGDSGASSTNFTSIMHNVISQAILAMKADGAADLAIAAIKRGEKPVLTVANTMGSFIKEVADDMGLKSGDPMPVTFASLLDRYLERTRIVTIRKPFMKKGESAEKEYLTDDELGPTALAAFKEAKKTIAKSNFADIPVSPIDHMTQRLRDAGYKVGEITGRTDTLDYSNPKETRFRARAQKEISIAGRRATISGFNDGTIDAVILNQAGATGLSLHASATFADKRKRHMILVQPEANIDTHMQMLGRIHRTGQVVLPSYDQMVADIPAEKRPAAVLAKKMASLNAATTASRKGALTADNVPDFMNEYGDRVAYEVMRENPMIHGALGEPLDLGGDKVADGAMRKVTGRIPLLDIPEQERIYKALEDAYADLVAQKEADGESILEAKLLDLDAKLIEKTELRPGDDSSPFTEAVTLETHSVKRQSPPYVGADFLAQLAKSTEHEGPIPHTDPGRMAALNKEWEKRQHAARDGALEEFKGFRREQVADVEKVEVREGMNGRFDQNETIFRDLMNTVVPGRTISIIDAEGERQTGVVLSVARTGDAQNPIALSTWKVKFAEPGEGVKTVPLSQLYAGYGDPPQANMRKVEMRYDPVAKAVDSFDQLGKGGREQRIIVTGNLLSGYDAVKRQGQIANFTDSEGNIRQGIVLKAALKSAADLKATIGTPLKDAGEVLAYVQEQGHGVSVGSTDSAVTIMRMPNGDLGVSVPASKQDGGKYFLAPKVKEALRTHGSWGADFEKRGSTMRVSVYGETEKRLVQALMDAGAKFETKPSAKAAPKQHASAGFRRVDELAAEARVANLKPEVRAVIDGVIDDVRGIIARVGGNHVNGVKFERSPFPVADESMRNSAGEAGHLAGGSFSDFIRLIRVALDTGNERSTAYHESMHALERGGAFTPGELRLLERETPRLREKIGRVYNVPAERLAKITDEEVRAYAFEDYAYEADRAPSGDPERPHIGIRQIFEKAIRILQRIRDYLKGKGWARAEDVFKKAYEGEVGKREARGNGAGMSPATVREMIRDNGMDQRFGFQESASGMKRYPNGDRRYFADETIREKIARKANHARHEAGTYVKEAFQDYGQRMLDFQRASEAAAGAPLNQTKRFYDQKRLLQGKTKAHMDDFNEAHLDPLLKAIKEHGLSRQDVAEYVFAKHAPERNALMDQRDPANNGKGSGVDDAEAQQILNRLGGKVALMDQHVAPIIQRIRDFNLDYAVRGGILTKAAATEWRNQMPTYVPLTGFEDASLMPDQHYFREGRKMGIFGKESETAFGRGTISADPLAALVRQSYRTIDRVERNRVGMTLWRNLRALSDQDRKDLGVKLDEGDAKKVIDPQTGLMKFVEKSPLAEPERVVSVKIGGLPHHIVFDDVRTARAINRMGAEQLPIILKQIKGTIDFAKSMWTHYNPDFVVRHFAMRYPIEAILNAGEHGVGAMGRAARGYPLAKPMRSILQAAKLDAAGRATLLQKFNAGQATEGERFQHYYWEARKAGAIMDFNALNDLDSLKRYMDQSVASISQKGQKADAARGQARAIHKAWNDVLQAMDNAHRLVAYIEARERGEDVTKAGLAARDATVDFGMRGMAANWINLIWPFGNTAIQTAARMQSAGARAGYITGKWAGLAVGGSFAAGFISSMFNYMFGGTDESGTSYQELIPEYTRRLNMSIVLPGTKDAKGEPYAMTIALPYNYAMPYTLGQAAAWGLAKQAGYAKEHAGHIVKMVTHSLLEGLIGMPQEDSVLAKVIPAPLVPALHVAMNENFYGGPVHTQFPKAGVAHSWQGRPTTSGVWDSVAKGVNTATGGDRYHPGVVDLYPEDYKETLGFFTSAFERFGKKSTSGSLGDIASGKMPVPEETPFLNTLLKGSKTYDQARRTTYYDMRNDLRDKAKAYDVAVKEGDEAGAQKLVESHGKEIAAHGALKDFETHLRTINKARNAIRADKTMADAEKERIGKELDEQSRAIQNQASKLLGGFLH